MILCVLYVHSLVEYPLDTYCVLPIAVLAAVILVLVNLKKGVGACVFGSKSKIQGYKLVSETLNFLLTFILNLDCFSLPCKGSVLSSEREMHEKPFKEPVEGLRWV